MKTLPTFNLGVSDAEPTLSPHTNKEPEAPSRSAMTSERDSLQGGESGDVDYAQGPANLSQETCQVAPEVAPSSGKQREGETRGPSFVLYARVLTHSERNLTRLRIWLVCRAHYSFASDGLCRFGPRSVLKFSRIAEAANVEYIARNTTIPVPRIKDVFTIDRQTYIVMDYIKGSELTGAWASLSAEQRNGIFKDLKGYIEQMRVLSPPNPGRLESADGSGLSDPRFGGQPFPIFDSVKEFHTHLGHDFVVNSKNHREAWSRFEAMGKRLYHTTFTHSDIAPRNIIVRKGKIAAIVDWETAGWYPEYWEYTRWAVSNFRSPQKWHDLRDEILTPYPDELWVDNYLEGVFTRF